MISTLIIDDEKHAAELLSDLLKDNFIDLNIIDLAYSAQDGFDIIQTQKPQLVFLDIMMPLETGFDLLNRINNPDFEIIFVTSYDSYAIKAFQMSAIGYVLKPIDISQLMIAVNIGIKRIKEKQLDKRYENLLSNLSSKNKAQKKIAIPNGSFYEFLEPDSIIRCEGVQGCTKVFSQNRKPIVSSYNLGEFVKLLENYDFFNVHKSHLISVKFLERYSIDGVITMKDGTSIPVARRRRKDFLDWWKRI